MIGENVCPIATSSTTDPTWTGLELNPDDRGERPSIKRLTHDRAISSGNSLLPLIRRGADKFLARPTSRCRRTESIVLERGVFSCAELQVFSCYRG